MHWGPDWNSPQPLLERFLTKPATAPGKVAAVDFMIAQLGSVGAVNALLASSFSDRAALLQATDGFAALENGNSAQAAGLVSGFLGQVAERYFQITTEAVRAADPNHLILGNREINVMTPQAVWEISAKYVDVISVNNYVLNGDLARTTLHDTNAFSIGDDLDALHALTQRPLLITEFSFRANDSGLPNSWPPVFPTYATQADRADAFEAYARPLIAAPWMVGYHWFRWVDEPPDGRFDGENSNFGLVNSSDVPYRPLVERMTQVNASVYDQLATPR